MDKTVLYGRDSKGKTKVWMVEVIEFKGVPVRVIKSGKLGSNNLVVKRASYTKGKNIGRANETTPYEQAVKESLAKTQKKRDKGYCDSLEELESEPEPLLPMLAHPYIKRSKYIDFPAYGQPKLDGVRCLVTNINGELSFKSRGGKEYETLHLHESLVAELIKVVPNGTTFDGEIYVHGWSLQRITSAVKKFKPETFQLEYWIYDEVSKDDFCIRSIRIMEALSSAPSPLVVVETYIVTIPEDVKTLHDEWVRQGFEGVIIRNRLGEYKIGHRSNDLQKYKEFLDAEFEIVGHEPEEQTINNVPYTCIVFRCKNEAGDEFMCRPRGSLLQRQDWWLDKEAFIGKMLTVRYQALTDSEQGEGRGVPQFPVGITVRDYE